MKRKVSSGVGEEHPAATSISRREFLKRSAYVAGGLATVQFMSAACAPSPTPSPTVAPVATKAATGEVVWYSTAPQDLLTALAKAFNASHPGLTLTTLYNERSTGVQLVEAEFQAGKPRGSLIMLASAQVLFEWRDKGILQEYHSPEESAYLEGFKEPGWWIGARVLDMALAYNTNLVPEEPKGWDIIADPKYKGKVCFVDAAGLVGPPILWYKLLKEKYGPAFFTKVAANAPKLFSASGQVIDSLVNGEAALGPVLGYQPLAALQKNAKAPIKMVWLAPTPVDYAPIAILKKAPNPEGARVVYDWLVSKDGQQLIADVNRTFSGRADVVLDPLRPKLNTLTWKVGDLKGAAAEAAELQAQWKKDFNRE